MCRRGLGTRVRGERYARSADGSRGEPIGRRRRCCRDSGRGHDRRGHDRRHDGCIARDPGVQGHSVRDPARRRQPLAATAARGELVSSPRSQRAFRSLHSRRPRWPERGGRAADERGLSLFERLDHGRCGHRSAPRDGLALRRRLLRRRGLRAALRRRRPRTEGRCGRHPQLSARCARLFGAPGAVGRVATFGLGQLRHARRRGGSAMGATQYRRVRRRPRQCDGVRRIGRRQPHGRARGLAGDPRAVPPCDRPERRLHGARHGAHGNAGTRRRSRRQSLDRRRSSVDRRRARSRRPKCSRRCAAATSSSTAT